jgi:hypothetical protein
MSKQASWWLYMQHIPHDTHDTNDAEWTIAVRQIHGDDCAIRDGDAVYDDT